MTSLEKMSNIAVIVVAIAVLGNNIYDRMFPPASPSLAKLRQQFIGKRLALSDRAIYGRNGTVVLFVSKDCHFCTESMRFYQRLAALPVTACDIKVIAVGPSERETRRDLEEYLARNSLKTDGIEMADFKSLQVAATPTLMLQNGARTVKEAWVGKLSPEKESEVVSTVKSLCGENR